MNSKEEKEKSLEGLSSSFETAAMILSSLKIEGIGFSPKTLEKLLLETFPGLSENQIEELVKVFSNGENRNE